MGNDEERMPNFMRIEVHKILSTLKCGQVAKPDEIENLTLKAFGVAPFPFLANLSNQFMTTGYIPKQ